MGRSVLSPIETRLFGVLAALKNEGFTLAGPPDISSYNYADNNYDFFVIYINANGSLIIEEATEDVLTNEADRLNKKSSEANERLNRFLVKQK